MSASKNRNALIWGLLGVGAVLATRALRQKKKDLDFWNKTVVITGGSRGLGLVMARQLAQAGAKVAICARDAAELDRAKTDLLQYTQSVFTYPCDVTSKIDVRVFIRAVNEAFGPVDVLINNAGMIIATPLENATEADFRETMETNFWSAFNLINEVLPQMRERRQTDGSEPHIVNIASLGGKVAIPHLLPYSASKFALVGYSSGLRTELKKGGIHVTTVCPGLIRTGSPQNAFFKGQAEKEYAWFKIADALPLLTVSAETCARAVLDACRKGQAELIVSVPAKVATLFYGLFPALTADLLVLANGLLPGPGIDEQRTLGKDSETPLSQSVLATLTDEAAHRNNEINSGNVL